ncbi:MAG: LysM peptidoglycan-binding domain-containing protein [Acidimicrobiales bacterium]
MPSTALQITALRLQPTTVPPGPGRSSRPELRLLAGGRGPARLAQQAVYRRRRVAAVLAAVVLAAVLLLASAAVARIAGGVPSSAAGAPSPTSAAAASAAGVAAPATAVVQPGDTLWSIAAAAAPDVDVRITVDRLIALNGGSPIAVGQELDLP